MSAIKSAIEAERNRLIVDRSGFPWFNVRAQPIVHPNAMDNIIDEIMEEESLDLTFHLSSFHT